jgi:hypothetical protein
MAASVPVEDSSSGSVRPRKTESFAILLVVLIFLGFRSRIGITAMVLTMSMVQLFDAVIGVLLHHPGKTYGPLFPRADRVRFRCILAAWF